MYKYEVYLHFRICVGDLRGNLFRLSFVALDAFCVITGKYGGS